MTKLSKTQIDRLGDRLRKDSVSKSDFIALDEYRRSFGEAYEMVVRAIREQLKLEPTGRPAKSTGSIIEKLHRESIRLSQIQDIAGCRIVVADLDKQDEVVNLLRNIFSNISIVDRRTHPSYGYRAVHVVVKTSEKIIEIQVRSLLQHLWAELSEKFSDLSDPAIKYGGGPSQVQQYLQDLSERVKRAEELKRKIALISKKYGMDREMEELEQQRIAIENNIKGELAKIVEILNRNF